MVPNDRWMGEVDGSIENLERQVKSLWECRMEDTRRINLIELSDARNKGRLEGGKTVVLLVGSLIGSAVGALVTWLAGKH